MKTLLFSPFLILLWIVPSWGRAQLVTVSGYVTHYLTGGALENVTIYDSVSGVGTISDKDGFYKLMLTPGKLNLVFSDPGFISLTERFTTASDTTLTIVLKPEKLEKSQGKTNADLQNELKDKEKGLAHRKKSMIVIFH